MACSAMKSKPGPKSGIGHFTLFQRSLEKGNPFSYPDLHGVHIFLSKYDQQVYNYQLFPQKRLEAKKRANYQFNL
jgi:hypothetical protein